MSTKHTPLPWFVRTQERLGEVRDCFVAAKDVQGMAYDAEILGDDEYRDGIERKLADAALIVQAVNSHAELVAIVRVYQSTLGNSREQCDEGGRRMWDRIEAAFGVGAAAGETFPGKTP